MNYPLIKRLFGSSELSVGDIAGLSVGDIVEVLNQEGEVAGNFHFCAKGARGRITSLFADMVTIDINGKEGLTRQSNVIRYKPE